ncbi:DNA internalization-related competence protein ComEC/Rec2 [Fangia hongkongensis]|uniref:DNA internalization-related competence protein ComEC/Rec2 n=3 Tax=Fangia hongkongensis TaxID=270495 RepID=UPI00035F9F8F|nr:DNA internalization-related competence protein ComEC/Rec2 [Fangia hongkongensis]
MIAKLQKHTKTKKPLVVVYALCFVFIFFHGLLSLIDYQKEMPAAKLHKPVQLSGVVASLPDIERGFASFLFRTEYGLIKLSVYPNNKFNLWRIKPGMKFRFWVKLRPPSGFKNPYVFDYGRWMRLKGIKATGYVVAKKGVSSLGESPFYFVEQLRYKIQKILNRSIEDKQLRALSAALLLGNKNELTSQDKKLFQQTGTSHLIAISGLHIGLIAFFAFVLVRIFWSLSIRACQWVPAQKIALVGAIFAAFFYSLLAGFSIPTQRAFIMVLVFSIAMLGQRKMNSLKILLLAGIIVVLWRPLSFFEVGFWLSFSAVLFLIFIARVVAGIKGIRKYVYIQFLLMLMLIPLTVYWFQGFSLIGVIANLLAIPWVSFIVVPSLFINLLLECFNIALWQISAKSISILIDWLSVLPYHDWYIQWHYISLWVALSVLFGIVMLLLPLRWPYKLLAICFIIPILQRPMWPETLKAKITVLDVGHGLSVVIEMKDYTVVYDTAAAKGNKFSIAYLSVIPYLKSQGVRYINTLVISHSDKDHTGGLEALLQHFRVDEIIASDEVDLKAYPLAKDIPLIRCNSTQSWQYHNVHFDFFDNSHFAGNNGSCVLKVSFEGQSVLFTGDIEKKAERFLLKTAKNQLKSTVLIAPHHGSKSSSSQAFINAVNASSVIFSAGDHQGFQVPNKEVQLLYQQSGAQVYSTNGVGAVIIYINKDGKIQLKSYQDVAETLYIVQ